MSGGSYREIEGNLLDLFDLGEFDVIGHGANCFCTMGSGIARQIALRYPEVYTADLTTKKGDRKKLGNHTFWENANGHKIYNLYTQYNYGRDPKTLYLNYDALRLSLRRLSLEYLKNRPIKIGLPQIGCGLGQGNWDKVKKIIQEELSDHHVSIVIFNPIKK